MFGMLLKFKLATFCKYILLHMSGCVISAFITKSGIKSTGRKIFPNHIFFTQKPNPSLPLHLLKDLEQNAYVYFYL